MSGGGDFLKDIWYFAASGRDVAAGRTIHKVLAGEPVLLGRTRAGELFALRDLCAHRGVPLTAGRLVETAGATLVECPYHGWRFGTDGICRLIPSLADGQNVDLSRIGVGAYPVREIQGNIWIWMPADIRAPSTPDIEPPVMPGVGDRTPGLVESMPFSCHVDHAVIGLLDPAHGPFVHQSWYWRRPASIHEKVKSFKPSPYGFAMAAHRPSSNSFAYRILGGDVETQITFRLPGIRIEHIKAGRHHVVGMTTVTPVDAVRTEITQSFFWTMPWLTAARPLLRPFVRRFLKQDGDMVKLHREGLRFDPRVMLMNDADVQAKWYLGLKTEWSRARTEGRAFVNPVRDNVLRWRT